MGRRGGRYLDWWGLLDTVGKGIEDGDGSDGDGWVGMVMHVIWAGASLRAEFRGGYSSS